MKSEIKNLISSAAIVFLLQFIAICSYSQTSKAADDTVAYLYLHVDKLPVFPGGSQGLKAYIKKHLSWPDDEMDVHGSVLVSFVVKASGEIGTVRVEKSLNKTFDAEAVSLVKRMPKWKSGKLEKRSVNVKLYLPIDFILR